MHPSGSIEAALISVIRTAVDDAFADRTKPIQREALKVTEAAEALGLSESTVRRLIAAGELPARRCGSVTLVPLSGLRAWLRGKTWEPSTAQSER